MSDIGRDVTKIKERQSGRRKSLGTRTGGSSIDSEIEEINKQLDKLGGR